MDTSHHSTKRRKSCLFIPLGIIGLCLLLAAASALSNLGLPEHSTVIDRLSEVQKAQLGEALHLRQSLGEVTWPGWGQADIPLIVYNERYAFLVGLSDPEPGWMKVPSLEQRGGPWEPVPGDSFQGKVYYRTPITDPGETPEGFTVLVGERWVATFQTREYGEVTFHQGLREELPPGLRAIFPTRLAWALLMGKSEAYVAALAHESFHAFEGMVAPRALDESESMYAVEAGYPYGEMEPGWREEMQVLVQAASAPDDAQALSLARRFLELRADRRKGLADEQVRLEKVREWEEGLAKYAELDLALRAATDEGYVPVEGLRQDPDFGGYAGREAFWQEQLKEAQNTTGVKGDTRFYYSGNALGILLDRLAPGWKLRAVPGGEFLDELVQEAVDNR